MSKFDKLVISILTEIYDYKKNNSLCGRIKVVAHKPEKVEKVMRHFLKRLYHEKDRAEESSEKRLARHTFKQLDHYVMGTLQENLGKKYNVDTVDQLMGVMNQSDLNALFHKLRTGLKQKRKYTQANLGLIVLGYLSMGICKMWPDSLIQCSVTWTMSLLYTSKMIWQKCRHSEWSISN